MGGETSKFLRLDTDCETGCAGIADYQTNGDCAAGTGSFMDQQASRLLYEIEDVGDIVRRRRQGGQHRRPLQRVRQVRHDPRPAEGLPAARGPQGLCDAVIRNYKGTITKGKIVEPPVAFIGGVAANQGAVQAVRDAFELEPGDLFVPELYAWMGAVGAALIEAEYEPREREPRPSLDAEPACRRPSSRVTDPLSMEGSCCCAIWPSRTSSRNGDGPVDAYMGIDIGSVSTNLVVIDDEGRGRQGDLHQDPGAPGRGRQRRPGRDPRRDRRRASTCAASAPPAPDASSSASSAAPT